MGRITRRLRSFDPSSWTARHLAPVSTQNKIGSLTSVGPMPQVIMIHYVLMPKWFTVVLGALSATLPNTTGFQFGGNRQSEQYNPGTPKVIIRQLGRNVFNDWALVPGANLCLGSNFRWSECRILLQIQSWSSPWSLDTAPDDIVPDTCRANWLYRATVENSWYLQSSMVLSSLRLNYFLMMDLAVTYLCTGPWNLWATSSALGYSRSSNGQANNSLP